MNQEKTEGPRSAFLLAQIGAHAAAQFAQRLVPLGLTPADAGILRILRASAGLSQQELSVRLDVHPSRIVGLLDKLENGGFIERRRDGEDRRLYSLHLTKAGVELLEKIGLLAREHQEAMSAGLNRDENDQLTELLRQVAKAQGLAPGVHPGYRNLEMEKKERKTRKAS